MVALVGENGAGKTTLVKLLARLYDPDEGRILLDGHDLRDYDLDALRGSMGVIFQDFVRYNLTAGDNIAVGRIEARDDRARIERAARAQPGRRGDRRLAGGYDQMIGKRFKNGVELSGGEWQKIAIARAYMREAEVLILDEPTAALDARSEFEVFQRFKELSQGKTAVLISHRFSSVRMADRILVLADGKVEAAGTHEELVAQPGRYAELFELQARRYLVPLTDQPASTGSPTICVRCIRRRRLSSKASRRCMTQRLSHITRSPMRHFWYQAKRSCVACAQTASSSFSLSSMLRPWM